MQTDMRIYNYLDNNGFESRIVQARRYFDEKFANIKAEVDLSEITERIDKLHDKIDDSKDKVIDHVDTSTDKIIEIIKEAKVEIIESVEDSSPCLCHLATKEDVQNAKCEVIKKIETTKTEMIEHIDDKFVDLNEQIKNN